MLVEESRNVVKRLADLGVEHRYLEFPGLEHGFDWTDRPRRKELDDVIPFLLHHMK